MQTKGCKLTGRRISTWKTISVLEDSFNNFANYKVYELDALGRLIKQYPIKRNRKYSTAYKQLVASSNENTAEKTTDLTDGNGNLNDGNSNLNDGNSNLNDGNGNLNDGNGNLNDGNGNLNDGNGNLNNSGEMEILKIESSVSFSDIPFVDDFFYLFDIDEEENKKVTEDEIFNNPYSFLM